MANPINKLIGCKIRSLRLESCLTLKSVGSSLGYTVSHVSNIEHGRINISVDHISRFSKLFDVPVEVFFEGIDVYRLPLSTSDQYYMKLKSLNERDARLIYWLIDNMQV